MTRGFDLKTLGSNITASFAARFVTGLLTLAFTPAYLSLLGVEAYGVVGTFASIQAVLYVFDFGFGLTLNRQLARLAAALPSTSDEMHDSVRTFEIMYVAIGVGLGLLIAAGGPFAAPLWFHATNLGADSLATATALLGVSLGLQWPALLFLGGLLGLQRQTSANVILTIVAFMRGAGAILVLKFVSPTLVAFFAWQIVASAAQSLLLRFRLLAVMPSSAREPLFRLALIKRNLSFAADLTGITILGTLLNQLDKVILSHTVALLSFGYYVLAGTASSSLNLVVSPIFNAVFPQLSATVSQGDSGATRRLYHAACQVMSVVVWPLAAVLFAFAPEILKLWVNSTETTTVILVRILVIGTSLNATMNIPYALMLASSLSRLPLVLNFVAVVVLVPLILYLTSKLGTAGGALAWLLLNIAYVTAGIAALHSRLLHGDAGRWYVADVGLPLVGAIIPVVVVRVAMPTAGGTFSVLLMLLVSTSLAFVGAAVGSGFVRPIALGVIRRSIRAVPGPNRSSS